MIESSVRAKDPGGGAGGFFSCRARLVCNEEAGPATRGITERNALVEARMRPFESIVRLFVYDYLITGSYSTFGGINKKEHLYNGWGA